MTKNEKDLIREYMGYGKEATYGVDPAWGPGENPHDAYEFIHRPRSHSMKFDFNIHEDAYKHFMGEPAAEKPVPYSFKIYDLVRYKVVDPKGKTLKVFWGMPKEGFND